MRLSYVPAPHSIYRGIRQLPPGCLVRLSEESQALPTPVPYWSARQVARQGQSSLFKGTEGEAVAELEKRLREAVGLRMVADVPLGAFLSGGVDSSTVVALMQAQSNRPVKTFSIGFHEAGYNEAEYARKVARHLGTDHTELYITAGEAQAVIPRLPTIFDEPFSDSSQIPTFLVSQLARRSVTVSLSGDGGDELFGGYNRYFTARSIWKMLNFLPVKARRGLAQGLVKIEPAAYDHWCGWLAGLTSKTGQAGPVGDKMHKLAQVLAVKNSESLYYRFISHWTQPGLVLGDPATPEALNRSLSWLGLPDFSHNMMYLDTISYLPGDILTKVDRASMAVSLEARVPLLDHRVVEFAWQLPLSMKIKKNQGKWILRQVLYKYVPPALIERPKMGFGVPIDSWLRGSLREWAESLLDEQRLRAEGFFEPGPIRAYWADHLSGQRNWHYLLWDVLMFQGWLEQWGHAAIPSKEQTSCAVL
jgi:asparagine synthase (glutamine-hydrolysing)